MARRTTTQDIEEESRRTGEPFAPAFDYESDMLAESKREQGYRGEAKRAKTPQYREYYTKRADEAHGKMQRAAETGYAARHSQRRAKKR